jgi:hypothetical protein
MKKEQEEYEDYEQYDDTYNACDLFIYELIFEEGYSPEEAREIANGK